MKGTLLFLLIISIPLCAHSLSSFALKNSSFKLEYERGVNLSSTILQGQLIGHGTVGPPNEPEYVSEKGQRGKTGVYGGGNIAHRPPQGQKSSAASTSHPLLFTKTLSHLGFSLILVLSFQLL